MTMRKVEEIRDRLWDLEKLDYVRLTLPDRVAVSTEKKTLKWVLGETV